MTPAARPRRLRALVIAVFAFVLVAALTFVAGWRLAAVKRARVTERWAAAYGSWEELLERYPARDANPAASEIERLGAAVGIDMAPRGDSSVPRRESEANVAYGEVKQGIGGYVQDELSREGGPVSAPSAEVREFLAARSAELTALRRALSRGSTPRWQLRIEDGLEAQVPNLLGHVQLQRLLAADALASARDGDTARALADLDAAWALNAALRDDPVLITQLVSMAITRIHAGLLRRIPEAAKVWRPRLGEHDYRATLMQALRVEARIWMHSEGLLQASVTNDEEPDEVFNRTLTAIALPYLLYASYDHSGRLLADLERADARESYCLDGVKEPFEFSEPAWWNMLSKIATPNLASTLERLGRLELDLELTDRWLAVAEARAAANGAWPESAPFDPASRACPGSEWIYELGAGGEASIALSRTPAWPGHTGLMLPIRVAAELETGTSPEMLAAR